MECPPSRAGWCGGACAVGISTGVQIGGERGEGEVLRDVDARQHCSGIVKPSRVWLPAAICHYDQAGIIRCDACKAGVPSGVLLRAGKSAALSRLVKVGQAVFVDVPVVAKIAVRYGCGLQDHPIPALACEVGAAHIVGPPARQIVAGVGVGLRG